MMEQEPDYRKPLKAAVCHTIIVVLYLFIIVNNTSMDNDRWEKYFFWALTLFFVASAVKYWIKGTKKYINFAIEEKFNQKGESASSPNENVST